MGEKRVEVVWVWAGLQCSGGVERRQILLILKEGDNCMWKALWTYALGGSWWCVCVKCGGVGGWIIVI